MECVLESGTFVQFSGKTEQNKKKKAASRILKQSGKNKSRRKSSMRMQPKRKVSVKKCKRKALSKKVQKKVNKLKPRRQGGRKEYLPQYCYLLQGGKYLCQKARKFTNKKSEERYETESNARHITGKSSLLDAMFVSDHKCREIDGENLYFMYHEATTDFSNLPVETIDVEEMGARILVVTKLWYGTGACLSAGYMITAIKDPRDVEWQAINMGRTADNNFIASDFEPKENCITPDQAKRKIENSTHEEPVKLRYCRLIGGFCERTKGWLRKKVQQECQKMLWQE